MRIQSRNVQRPLAPPIEKKKNPSGSNPDKVELSTLESQKPVKSEGWLKRSLKTAVNLDRGLAAAASILGPVALPLALTSVVGSKNGSLVSRLHRKAPRLLQTSLGRALEVAARPSAEAGLPLGQLVAAERNLQDNLLAPVGEGSSRRAPQLIRDLADGKINQQVLDRVGQRCEEAAELNQRLQQLSPYPAIVDLGPKESKMADEIGFLFNHTYDSVGQNPYAESKYGPVWDHLVDSSKRGKMPVYIDFDGDYQTPTVGEELAMKTVESLVERSNTLGDDFTNPQIYYRWLAKRVEQFASVTRPWLQTISPEVVSKSDAIKEKLAPLKPSLLGRVNNRLARALGREQNQYPMFWKPHPRKAQEAYEAVLESVPKEGADGGAVVRFADLVTSLDRDLYSGVQTHWIRLLRQLQPEQRSVLLKGLAGTFLDLNLASKEQPLYSEVAPEGAPPVQQLLKEPGSGASDGKLHRRSYDRAQALAEVVDHTIDGLGHKERREFTQLLRKGIRERLPALRQREQRISEKLDGEGFPLEDLLGGKPAGPGSWNRLSALADGVRKFHTVPDSLSREQMLDFARHQDLMALLVEKERFGNPLADLDPEARAALARAPHQAGAINDLALGEFYQPIAGSGPAPIKEVSQQRQQGIVLGAGPRSKVSMVLEGGGGKGFCYVECLRQTQQALAASREGSFEIDEFVGTSAGAITAGLLAAGYDVDQLAAVMQQLDFKEFFADYVWNQGGTDPKARGINRTGMFSTQKMYRDIHGLLADKLGVTNRPILFRDLPHKLKVVTTVMNHDLPEEHPLAQQIGDDGELVLSAETTPNFDVVAAMAASASIPGVFSSPQLLVDNGTEEPHRIQLVDGGVVNNFPVARASRESDSGTALAVLPAYFGPLSTLDFGAEPDKLGPVEEQNRSRYQDFMPALVQTLNAAREVEKTGRIVLGYNLSADQEEPIVQGGTRIETERLLELSRRNGLRTASAEQGAGIVSQDLSYGKPTLGDRLAHRTVKWLMDDPNQASIEPGRYRPPSEEFDSLDKVLAGTAGARLAARQNCKWFEV